MQTAVEKHWEETFHIHGLPLDLVLEVQSLIDAANKGDAPPVTALEDIWEICEARVPGCKSDHVLMFEEIGCHPSNRAKQGLNGHNAHKNGKTIFDVGCDPRELAKAMSMEISHIPAQKSM